MAVSVKEYVVLRLGEAQRRVEELKYKVRFILYYVTQVKHVVSKLFIQLRTICTSECPGKSEYFGHDINSEKLSMTSHIKHHYFNMI